MGGAHAVPPLLMDLAVVLGTAYVNVLNSYAVASRLNEGRE